jgi:hypothetical protein
VENVIQQADGASQVYVKLTYKETFETYGRSPKPADTFSWPVAAVVVFEDGRYVVNDILFFKEDSTEVDYRLSHFLTLGCDGSRWIGYQESRSK